MARRWRGEGLANPRFWHRLSEFRRFCSGSLALASPELACWIIVPAFPQRSPRRRAANNPRPALAGGLSGRETQKASAALSGRDVAGSDLVFMGGKSRQDFGLLALGDLREVQAPSEFRGDLIEFGGGSGSRTTKLGTPSTAKERFSFVKRADLILKRCHASSIEHLRASLRASRCRTHSGHASPS
jgi:hypothetical protein